MQLRMRSGLMPFWLIIGNLFANVCVLTESENINIEYNELPKNISIIQNSVELPSPLLETTRISRQNDGEEELNIDHSSKPSLMDIALQISARQGLDAMTELYTKIEPNIIKNGQLLDEQHPATLLSKFSAPTIEVPKPNPEMAAYAVISATKAFRKNYKYINDLARQAHSSKISLRRTALESLCPPRDPPTCMPASQRYRTHDGTCNNRRRPRWGSSQMPFNRFLPPVYGDGVDSIRNSVEGGTLSSSRFVSLLVHGAKDGEAPVTLMIAQWGQLLDHDMTATAQPRSINGSVPSCCGNNDFHPSCFPIKVPLDDPWLAPLKVRCLEFLRSAPAQRRDCTLSWREQTNQATSYIDASPIYSNSAKSSDNGRVFRNGLLVYGRGDPSQDVCQRGAMATQCIRAGDGRSSEQPGLLALHHVWVGEHNRIALELSELNAHWSDEKIYQETRRIVGAMFQHITYREFLPLILGKEVCKLFDLELLNSGHYEGYDHKVNPTVANSFSAAAFRFGHSLVQNSYMRCDRHHNIISNNVSLHEEFQRGDIGSAGSLHRLLRGMATQRALKRDEFITPELTNHLFQTPGFPFGLDLAAINIQRGRDHGIPPYTAWRIPCGLTPLNTWEDFENVVGPESAQRIRHAYRSVHDIDLFVGGIAERPVVGGLVGPTFACIIAQQFSNSRKGDRFWYENGNFENSFTPAQLHALRRVSLAQVLCRTVGGGTFQPHIFLPPEFQGNERIPCGKGLLAQIDLSPWLEQDPFITPKPSLATQNPDRVFEIVSEGLNQNNPLTNPHVINEDKIGFQNRVRPVKNTTSVNLPHVDLIPNASIGHHRPQNFTKINDKLDIKHKGTTTRRPIQNQHLTGINNKLGSNRRITLNIKGVNKHRMKTTNSRTVIVNNVPIELRNVEGSSLNKTNELNTEDEKSITTKTATIKLSTTKHKKNKKPKNRIKIANPHHARLDKEAENILSKPVTAQDVFVFHDENFELLDNSTVRAEDVFDIFGGLTESTNIESAEFFEDLRKLNEPQDMNLKITDNLNTLNRQDSKELDDGTEISLENSFDLDAGSSKEVDDKQTQEEHSPDLKQNDIDPLLMAEPIKVLKRVQRKLTKPQDTTNLTKEISSRSATKIRPVTTSLNLNLLPKNITFITERNKQIPKILFIHNLASTANNPTTTTARSRPKKTTTPANSELRQYQTVQTYTRPHQVIVKRPNTDAYEIKINIKQTSAVPPLQAFTSNNYVDYLNADMYKPYNNYDRYSPSYLNYMTTTPSYTYYKPPPNSSPYAGQAQKPTKPPTIIYLNEHDRDDRLTTQHPNIFQNFLNFATNDLRPTPISGHKERPDTNSNYFPSSSYSSNQANYQYGLNSETPYPVTVSSPSQTDGAHASSSAVSSGNFGAIFGVASANGADTTFSFNIRPKPSINSNYGPVSPQRPIFNQVNTPEYGPISPQRPIFNQVNTPEYVNLPISSVTTDSNYEAPYREQVNSPFSTHKRPNKQGHYSRTQNIDGKEIVNSNVDRDYDYLSRAILLAPLFNVSSIEEYNDEDYNSDENIAPVKKYDRDGYLRPEHMLKQILNEKQTNQRSNLSKSSNLDDNFVLPKMSNISFGLIEIPKPMEALKDLMANFTNGLTELPDTNAKHINNDIQAESDDKDDTTEPLEISTIAALTAIRKSPPSIPFALINVLTKPERPDNWVIYDTPANKPLLPDPPEVKPDATSINEIPKPLLDQSGTWLQKKAQQSMMENKEPLQTESTPD